MSSKLTGCWYGPLGGIWRGKVTLSRHPRREPSTGPIIAPHSRFPYDLVVSLDGHAVGLLQRAVINDYPEDVAEFAAVVDVSTYPRYT